MSHRVRLALGLLVLGVGVWCLFLAARQPRPLAAAKPAPAATPAAATAIDVVHGSHRPPNVPSAYVPPAVADPALSRLVDRRLGLDERVPANATALFPLVCDEHDLGVLVALLSDPTEQDTVRNEVANLLHRSGFAGLADTLVKVLENTRPRRRGFGAGRCSISAAWSPRESTAATFSC